MAVTDWLAERMSHIEMSGVRRVFELGRTLRNPIDLSIGQPHFPVPEPIRAAAHAAIEAGRNGYTVTQGLVELRERLRSDIALRLPGQDREPLVTSGTSGGLFLAMMTTINPGDEVILFDPYFVAYPHLVTLAGGVPILVDTYPSFVPDLGRVEAAFTARTKLVLFNSPANPTGVVPSAEFVRELALLCARKGVLLVSDEIYRAFDYDGQFHSPAEWNPDTLVVDGFGKTYGMTGWRMGFAHGPRRLIEEMAKLQQFTFVCSPAPFQHATLAALDFDTAPLAADYRRKRDRLTSELAGLYEFAQPGGAFYLFSRAPWGTASEFVAEAIRHNLLIIPSSAFSKRDTHFRLSFAADDALLTRGIEVLRQLARKT